MHGSGQCGNIRPSSLSGATCRPAGHLRLFDRNSTACLLRQILPSWECEVRPRPEDRCCRGVGMAPGAPSRDHGRLAPARWFPQLTPGGPFSSTHAAVRQGQCQPQGWCQLSQSRERPRSIMQRPAQASIGRRGTRSRRVRRRHRYIHGWTWEPPASRSSLGHPGSPDLISHRDSSYMGWTVPQARHGRLQQDGSTTGSPCLVLGLAATLSVVLKDTWDWVATGRAWAVIGATVGPVHRGALGARWIQFRQAL